jgi:hypothetical protein
MARGTKWAGLGLPFAAPASNPSWSVTVIMNAKLFDRVRKIVKLAVECKSDLWNTFHIRAGRTFSTIALWLIVTRADELGWRPSILRIGTSVGRVLPARAIPEPALAVRGRYAPRESKKNGTSFFRACRHFGVQLVGGVDGFAF